MRDRVIPAAAALDHWAAHLAAPLRPTAAAGSVGPKTGAGVSVTAWANEALETCTWQAATDAKPFTGRGSLRELRHYVDILRAIEERMDQLSRASKTVPGLDHYLMVHRRPRTGYVHLRWRAAGGAKQHVSWGDMAQRRQRYAGGLRDWVVQATSSALEMNAQHTHIRAALREVRQLVQAREQPVFARART
jgi:hypothetical protein